MNYWLNTNLKKIEIVYRLGDWRKRVVFDLTEKPSVLFDKIYANTWWPDGNSQGVFEEIHWNKEIHYTQITGHVSSLFGDSERLSTCDFCKLLNDGTVLGINRFSCGIFKQTETSITVGQPCRANGRLNEASNYNISISSLGEEISVSAVQKRRFIPCGTSKMADTLIVMS